MLSQSSRICQNEIKGIHTGFFRKLFRFVRKNYQIFPQTLQCSQDYSKSFPIRRFVRRKQKYPIQRTILFFLKKRRFGGVGAPEGRENVPDIYTSFSRKIKKNMFLAEYVGYIPKFSAKYTKLFLK